MSAGRCPDCGILTAVPWSPPYCIEHAKKALREGEDIVNNGAVDPKLKGQPILRPVRPDDFDYGF